MAMKIKTAFENLDIKCAGPMRDPMGDLERYKRDAAFCVHALVAGEKQARFNNALATNIGDVASQACNNVQPVLDRMILMYACGEPLSAVAHRLEADLAFVMEVKALRATALS